MVWTDPNSRSFRIVLMLSFVVLAGLCDLYMTKTYLVSFGLVEQNPFARLLFSVGSTSGLMLGKVITLGLVAFISMKARRYREMELGLLVGCVISMGVMIRWAHFNNQIIAEFNDPHAPPFDGEPNWITASPIHLSTPSHMKAPSTGDQSR